MGFFDFLRKRAVPAVPTATKQTSEPELTYHDKERITVNRVTIDNMREITALPYIWNTCIKKSIVPNGHPFAYIDLIGPNIDIAKQELEKINGLLVSSEKLSPSMPKSITIPINKIVFTPQKYHGHTRLMCTPHTFTGEPAKYPASLSFMTDLSNDTVSTHGELFYGQDGNIQKADIFCWRTNGSHFYYFDTFEGTLVLIKLERNGEIVYKAPHILAKEALRIQEEKDFAWLQVSLPNKCPKSISSFRRMKTQNTRNYQALKQFAAEHGREI